MCIKTKYYKMDQVPKEQKEYFESLIGHTPFSFFKILHHVQTCLITIKIMRWN